MSVVVSIISNQQNKFLAPTLEANNQKVQLNQVPGFLIQKQKEDFLKGNIFHRCENLPVMVGIASGFFDYCFNNVSGYYPLIKGTYRFTQKGQPGYLFTVLLPGKLL